MYILLDYRVSGLFRDTDCVETGREVRRYGDRQAAHYNDTHPDITKYHQTFQGAPPRGWSQRDTGGNEIDYGNGSGGREVGIWIDRWHRTASSLTTAVAAAWVPDSQSLRVWNWVGSFGVTVPELVRFSSG